jgi:hypothetical protein
VRSLHAEHFDDNSLPSLPIELRIKYALPRTKVEFAASDGQSSFMMQEKRF